MTSKPPCCERCSDPQAVDGCSYLFFCPCHTESAADGGWSEEFCAKFCNPEFIIRLNQKRKFVENINALHEIEAFISDLLRKEGERAEEDAMIHGAECYNVGRGEGAKAEKARILAALEPLAFYDLRKEEPRWFFAERDVRRIIQSPPTSQNEGV